MTVWCIIILKSFIFNTVKPSTIGCTTYTGTTCLQELKQHNNCLSCNDSYITIKSSADQEAKEKTARIIKTSLSALGASQTCISQLVPFMCLYLFPLCGTNATAVSREQCIQISTDVCEEQWQMALEIPTLKDQIPNCGNFPSMAEKGLSFIALTYFFICTFSCQK